MKFILKFLILSFLLFNCKKSETIKITGSETMHSMILQVSNEFSKENSNMHVEVKGGGSGEGIQDLISGIVDIAVSSRDLDESEFEKLNKDHNLESIIVAYDGAAFVVHPSNPIDKITLAEAADIFSGKVKNWKEVGGKDAPIDVFIRDSYSGTAQYILDQVVRKLNLSQLDYFNNKKSQYLASAKVMINNDEIIDQVNKNPNSISYMGMGIANMKSNLKLLKYAKLKQDEAVSPNIENIINRKYKLSRALRLFYKTSKATKKNEEFVNFILSEKGQKTILQSGYLRSTLEEVEVKTKK